MKISDLSTTESINEGIFDALAQQFTRKDYNNKKRDEKIKEYGRKDFYNQLTSSLQAAIKSGVVVKTDPSILRPGAIIGPVVSAQNTMNSPYAQELANNRRAKQASAIGATGSISRLGATGPDPGSTGATGFRPNFELRESRTLHESQYKLFNKLVESSMLTESESVSKFVQDFVKGQTRGFVNNPAYSNNIKMIADKLDDHYAKKGTFYSKLVDQLWETIWAWSKLGKKQSSGYGSFTDMDHDGTDDSIERTTDRKRLLQKIIKTDFNDPDQLKLLKSDLEKLLATINAIS